MVSRGLTFGVLLLALMSLMSDDISEAQQIRVDDRVVAGGTEVGGLTLDGNVVAFKMPGGAFRPTIVGFLDTSDAEPTLESQHRATWPFCEGPPEAVKCGFRFNYFGTTLEVASGQWNLQ